MILLIWILTGSLIANGLYIRMIQMNRVFLTKEKTSYRIKYLVLTILLGPLLIPVLLYYYKDLKV